MSLGERTAAGRLLTVLRSSSALPAFVWDRALVVGGRVVHGRPGPRMVDAAQAARAVTIRFGGQATDVRPAPELTSVRWAER